MNDDPSPKANVSETEPAKLVLGSLRYISLASQPYAEVSVGCSVDVPGGIYHTVSVDVKLVRTDDELFSMTLREIESAAVEEAKRVLGRIE